MRTGLAGLLGRLCIGGLVLLPAAGAAAEARAVIVLDATAQMNAHLGGRKKIAIARASISGALAKLGPKASVSLWTFGGNPQKKCEDRADVLSGQKREASPPALTKALARIRPKASRAPALSAVEEAVKAQGGDGPVSAVLIAGTGDDCAADVCAAARALHDAAPQAKLTVFGLGANEKAAAAYTCAANAMGGTFTAIKAPADLDKALRQTFADAQAEAAKAAPAATSLSPAEDKPAAPPAPLQPEPNVVLSATLAPGLPPLDAGVTWKILKMTRTPTGQMRAAEAPLWVGAGGQAKAKLPEGRYKVNLAYGLTTADAEFAVEGSRVERTIALDAGTIAAEALKSPGGEPAAGAFFTLYRQGANGAREEIGRSSIAPAVFQVNGGNYIIAAMAGLAKVEAPVRVEGGKVSVVSMTLNVGTLAIKALAAPAATTPVSAWHRLFADDTSPVAKPGAPLLRLSGASPRIDLPAGTYRLETVYGTIRDVRTVSVAAGRTTAENIVLDAGEAKILMPPGKQEGICAVSEAGARADAAPIRAAGGEPRFILKAGRYDLECRAKNKPDAPRRAEIVVVAGEVKTTNLGE
ncbi:VWA domain-containing protein [Rhodomicrobium sp. Az07]|uniref:vWA domain-containing protein n=1 Tax=Rhodomicrobium sp. Az07 TaxID=2839034 RepID=UPI001BE58BC5|nr:vWA domain-containing protein [Rhodomicrobium sp. Az07]MBT3070846.1 VWA domain-containing protein [Rhodomicrobium sp. Az07]